MTCGSGCRKLCGRLVRKKPADVWLSDSPLKRCLNTLDLTSIGIGSVVGAGLYVLTGELARDVVGPAVVLSFLIAAVSAVLSGICYAEFGCRIPRTGSAYVYSYVALGEIWAFVVGWNMVLEYVIGAASLARASSEYINSLAGGWIYKQFMKAAIWDSAALGNFPDFLAMLLAIVMAAIVSLGARQSSIFNKAMTFVNLLAISFIMCVGFYFADGDNWTESFTPYGAGGVFTAASSCFFAFVGFDVIATASEEAIDPKKSIPLSIVLSLAISAIAYVGVASALTLMLPYNKLSRFAALAEAFAQVGLPFAKYVVAVGGLCATFSTLTVNLFAAPRVIYSMAVDGLLPRYLSTVNDSTQVPVRASIVVGMTVAILALLLDLKQLVEMLSIGTLVAYTMVAIAVLLTRFLPDVQSVSYDEAGMPSHGPRWLQKLCCATPVKDKEVGYHELKSSDHTADDGNPNEKEPAAQPTADTSYRASVSVALLTVSIACFCIVITKAANQLENGEAWAWFLVCMFGLLVVTSLVVLMRQPRNSATFPFTVPCVPLLPTLTIFVNVLLLVSLNHWTYVRFAVWMTLGTLVYTFHGYANSIEGAKNREKPNEFIISETPTIGQKVEELQSYDVTE